MEELLRLRSLALPLRLGLSALLLVLAGGYAASVAYVFDHHGRKDEVPGLSLTDITGAYHGVVREAPLLRAVEGEHGREFLDEEAAAALGGWLRGEDLYENYDPLDSLDASPAELLEESCVGCHARTAEDPVGQTAPLEDWNDVSKLAFTKRLDPVPTEILVVSTHAHAQSMPLVGLLAALLFLLTRWPRLLRHLVFAAVLFGALADLGGMWLARSTVLGVWVLLAGGALFGVSLTVAVLGSLADLWLPPSRDGQAGASASVDGNRLA